MIDTTTMDTMEATVAAAPEVAEGFAPDRGVAFQHPASNSARIHLSYHRAKMAAHFAGTAETNLEVQRMNRASRKGKSRVLNRTKV